MRFWETIVRWKDIENIFYANDSINNYLKSEIDTLSNINKQRREKKAW